VKLFGLFLFVFAVGSILYEKVIRPDRFPPDTHPAIRFRRAFTDWGLIALGIALMVFAPWSCD
jgi:hypothetical protein